MARGTSFDEALGMCVPDSSITCGAGTVPSADMSECVPDTATLCGMGTMADADGNCVVSDTILWRQHDP